MRTRGDQCLNMGDLGGHQVAAVFCCKSICRLVTLIERCFRTVACMCVEVLVHEIKFPAMVICLMPTVHALLSHVCLLDGSLCLLSLVFAFSTREGYRLVSPNTFYAFACVRPLRNLIHARGFLRRRRRSLILLRTRSPFRSAPSVEKFLAIIQQHWRALR